MQRQIHLSDDAYKNRMTTPVITLARTRNVLDNVCVSNVFSCWNNNHFEGNVLNIFLHLWSFHMLFMKLAEKTTWVKSNIYMYKKENEFSRYGEKAKPSFRGMKM